MLCTPTLTTPRTAEWNLFSPARLSSTSSSPGIGGREVREPPTDLPLDSSIGLSSPHDGILAKRRKLKQQNSGTKSVESDSNSCDTPDSIPKDLSNHTDRQDENHPTDLSTTKRPRPWTPGYLGPGRDSLDLVRDRVGAVNISASSPKWFKHPRTCESRPQPGDPRHKDDGSLSYHPSPLAVPSPNWSTINDMVSEGFALKTPKVLDNFVFDVLPPNTPNTPKVREKSPESMYDRHLDRRHESDPRSRQTRVTFANQPRPVALTPPPPPYPQDLSLRSVNKPEETSPPRHKPEDMSLYRHREDMYGHRHRSTEEMLIPKQEIDDCVRSSSASPALRPSSTSPRLNGEIKEEPREYTALPPGFPPYYLHPGITPGHMVGYRGVSSDGESGAPPRSQPSPPASPPLSLSLHPFYGGGAQGSRQFYPHNFPRHHHPLLYDQQQGQPNYLWSHQQTGSHEPPWGVTHTGSNYLKPGLVLPIKQEGRLSTDSPDLKKINGVRKSADEESVMDKDGQGQPMKKKGKGKKNDKGDPNGPKRVFVCPHCQRSYDWNYNLNRHLKYECGKENSFMCSKCGRRFPHKQNCVYHLKRKHKIMCDTVDQYVSSGLVVYQGAPGGENGPPCGPGLGGGPPPKSTPSPGEAPSYAPPEPNHHLPPQQTAL